MTLLLRLKKDKQIKNFMMIKYLENIRNYQIDFYHDVMYKNLLHKFNTQIVIFNFFNKNIL